MIKRNTIHRLAALSYIGCIASIVFYVHTKYVWIPTVLFLISMAVMNATEPKKVSELEKIMRHRMIKHVEWMEKLENMIVMIGPMGSLEIHRVLYNETLRKLRNDIHITRTILNLPEKGS